MADTEDHIKALQKRMRLDPLTRREISIVLIAEGAESLEDLAVKPANETSGVSGADLIEILAHQYVEIDETATDTQQWYADNLRPTVEPEMPPS